MVRFLSATISMTATKTMTMSPRNPAIPPMTAGSGNCDLSSSGGGTVVGPTVHVEKSQQSVVVIRLGF